MNATSDHTDIAVNVVFIYVVVGVAVILGLFQFSVLG